MSCFPPNLDFLPFEGVLSLKLKTIGPLSLFSASTSLPVNISKFKYVRDSYFDSPWRSLVCMVKFWLKIGSLGK